MRLVSALGVVVVAAAAANADTVTFEGGSYMTFSDATPGLSAVFNSSTVGGTSHFYNGLGIPLPNHLKFTGSDAFSTNSGSPFVVGSMSYFNGSTLLESDAVVGTLTVDFTAPPGLGEQGFSFNFDFVFTPNIHRDPVANSDVLSVSMPESPAMVTVDGVDYTLMIRGFLITAVLDADGSDLVGTYMENGLWLPECATVKADLIAEFVAAGGTHSIPLPTTAGMAAAGGAMLLARRRRTI